MPSSDLLPLGVRLNDWSGYIKMSNKPASPELAGLATFHARFQLASKFSGLTIEGMASGTLAVYSRVTRIGLCYSALEYLERLIGIRGYPEILAPDLVRTMRNPDFKEFMDAAKSGFKSHAVKEELEKVLNNRSRSDVRPFIMLCRNSLFHGEFTPGGWRMRPNREMFRLLDSLAQVTLRKADETFSGWLSR